MDWKKRLLRRPGTTLLWIVLGAVMAAFLTVAAALWVSSARLSAAVDARHTAIAVRTDRAVSSHYIQGGMGWDTEERRFPQEERDWLTYIREHCASEDCYGIYGAYGSAYWWWEEGQRVLHIMGAAAVNLPEDEAGYYEEHAGSSRKIYMDQGNSHPACIAICCGWDASITKLVIHEGIRIFSYVPLMNIGWNLSFDEVILPPTLREMPIMKCYADHVTIPESVSEIDLAAWYKSNVFCCDIDILYPASWDEGAETSFRDRVVSYVRSQKPMYGKMSGMDSEWFEWGEEEYRALWERVRTY